VLQQLQRVHAGRRVPHIVFTKGGAPWLEAIGRLGADMVGVDWTVDLGAARHRLGPGVALQGNLDPAVLFAPPSVICAEALRALKSVGATGFDGHVFNLGHGISQFTPPEHVEALVAAVHEQSRRLRAGEEA